MALQWSSFICAIIENSLGQVMAQNSAPLHHTALAQQWSNGLARVAQNIRYAPPALTPSATLGSAALAWIANVTKRGRNTCCTPARDPQEVWCSADQRLPAPSAVQISTKTRTIGV
jgi:hypothetical protein